MIWHLATVWLYLIGGLITAILLHEIISGPVKLRWVALTVLVWPFAIPLILLSALSPKLFKLGRG